MSPLLHLLCRCDRYFFIPARKEHRGIGGIFFDDLEAAEPGFDAEDVRAAFMGFQGLV